MTKRLPAMLAACVLTLLTLFACAQEQEENIAERRALLVGCDDFISQTDTAPSAQMNVRRMRDILRTDKRGYSGIYTYDTGISSVEMLLAAIDGAFSGADDNDVSLLYICTHGLNDRITANPLLVLSDGESEESLFAQTLREKLDQLPGQKVLLLDACNSGAFIGKGEWNSRMKNWFQGADYAVLTSAGASENSFLWKADPQSGGSYFADGLSEGLRTRTFDRDRDGTVTLYEAYQSLLESHGASTAQIYPQQSDFPLYVYDPLESSAGERPIGGIELDTAVLGDAEDTLYFSFTVHRAVRVQYQLVYYKDGRWRFDAPQILQDDEGVLSPGRKQRSVTLVSEDGSPAGYVLLQIVATEGRHATLAGSRLISVQPDTGDPRLAVDTFTGFSPAEGEEMPLRVSHDFPCSLTVVIRDRNGNAVRRLSYREPSRPLGMVTECSMFYWDGTDNDGLPAPDGEYYAEVSCRTGGETYTAVSPLFFLE